jgi:DNA-binding XRE family transcriptional regulator
MDNEVWKPIGGAPGYSVSNLGRVRNDKTGRFLTPQRSGPTRHDKVGLSLRGRVTEHTIPRLVADAFLDPAPHPSNRLVHIDGNKRNNAATNLMWRRRAELATEWGTAAQQKLTPDEVREIRTLYARGGVTQRELGAAFGVEQTTISSVVNERTWREYIDSD